MSQETENTQFEILNRVDVGGMAEIFRAKNLSTGEIVAIKRILPQLVGNEDFVNMFIDEAAICMLLHHPNIVRVDQIGLMDDALFLAMEFVDGTNLREILGFASQYKFKLPIHEAVRIAILVLDGLEYAHHLCDKDGNSLNMIHRDVSPPNILLGYNGDVKLTDFGLVKSKAQISHTVPGLIKGKFSYLSPEAAYGESIDLRSDIYAVGIILWEMLTSRPLFTDPVEMKILDLVRKSIVPPIAPINPAVPPELEAIVMKGLARNRSDRYQTAAEFANDLRSFLNSIGNPKSELGKIVTAIKPPDGILSADIPVLDFEDSPAPENHTTHSDDQAAQADAPSHDTAPKSDNAKPSAGNREAPVEEKHLSDDAQHTNIHTNTDNSVPVPVSGQPDVKSKKKIYLIVMGIVLIVLALLIILLAVR